MLEAILDIRDTILALIQGRTIGKLAWNSFKMKIGQIV